jgi:acetyl-CoA carboxylase biotin carboxyl carrier protein
MTVKVILAPIPGTFYRRPAPDKPVFKNEGDNISKGETVGLIEVMKTFAPVEATEDGRVMRFLVNDEDAVMAGQPLYEIEAE